MDEYELTPEEKKAQKMAKIAFQRKKRNTNLFLFCTCIIQIVVTLAIIVALFILSLVIISRVFGPDSEVAAKIMQILMFVEFIGGLILGFMAFSAIVRFIIKKFDLESKINADVIARYKKQPKDKKQD